MNIDQNHQVVHVVAPQDQKIATLNRQLNQTYLPYGVQDAAAKRQEEQDVKTNSPLGMLAERVKSKVSAV